MSPEFKRIKKDVILGNLKKNLGEQKCRQPTRFLPRGHQCMLFTFPDDDGDAGDDDDDDDDDDIHGVHIDGHNYYDDQ